MSSPPMVIGVQRAGEWLEGTMARRVYERLKAGDPVTNIGRDELAQAAIERYQPHIINAMQRAGLPLPDDGVITPETLTDAIGRALDLDLPALTPEAIADALDRRMAREVSARLGCEVATLRDPDAIKEACKAAVIEAIRSGKANKLISATKIKAFRRVAAFAQSGLSDITERRRVMSRYYQKKWRRTHRLVWDELSGPGRPSGGAPPEPARPRLPRFPPNFRRKNTP